MDINVINAEKEEMKARKNIHYDGTMAEKNHMCNLHVYQRSGNN